MSVATVLGPIGALEDHAHTYAAAGLDIFPVNPRDKTPLVSQHQATTDQRVISAWWQQWPTALIGHRIAPGQIVLDVDPRHGGLETWKAIRNEVGTFPSTRGHASGRGDGGGHTWWIRPADKLSVRALTDWAQERGLGHDVGGGRWTAGIDLLHHGHRYTILPPSPHPDTGKPYTWIDGHGLHIPPAPLPQFLVDLLVDDRPPAPPAPPRDPDPDSIADWYSDTYRWSDLLSRHGWTLVGGDGDTDGARWRHPTATSAFSATIRHRCLFVYSPNTPFDDTAPGDPHGYTLFRAWSILDHGGDLKAAGRAAREQRSGPPAAHDDLTWIEGPAAPTNNDTAPAGEQEADKRVHIDDATIADLLTYLTAHTTWAPIDLVEVAHGLNDGTLTAPQPEIGSVTGTDIGLFYRARINGLYAKGGDGKSWIALLACAERLAGEDIVWWIDFEDNEIGITSRLLDLGVPIERLTRFRYYRPNDPLNDIERALIVRLAQLEQPSVIVIDSTGESMAVHGVKPNADEEVARWFQTVAKPLADTGAAVIAIDHLPHDADGRLSAIGSTRKYNAVSGSAYVVKVLAEFGRGRIGRSALTSAKDRWGHHVRGKVAAEFTLDATGLRYSAELALPFANDTAVVHPLGDQKPAVQRVYDALIGTTEAVTWRTIGDIVAGDKTTGLGLKQRTIQDALKTLEDLGHAVQQGVNEVGAYLWTSTELPAGNSAHAGPISDPQHAHPYAHPNGAHDPYIEEF